MLNITLYKHGLRGSWKSLLIIIAILIMYFAMIIPMFDPAMSSALAELYKAMPEIMEIVGMKNVTSSLTGFLSSYLYGMLMLIFPMIYTILSANSLVARHVERGSMTYLLSAPINRRTVALTQLFALITGVAAIIAVSALCGITLSEASFPGALDIDAFLAINAGALCLHLFIAGICFLTSCAFDDTKLSIGFGAGIPTLAYVIQMLGNAGGDLAVARNATFFTLFNPDNLAAGEPSAILGSAILLLGAIVLFASAVTLFSRRDLSI